MFILQLKKIKNAPPSLLAPPPPPRPLPPFIGEELRGAESLQSPTLTGPPA